MPPRLFWLTLLAGACAAADELPRDPDVDVVPEESGDDKADDGELGDDTGVCPFAGEPRLKAVFSTPANKPDLTIENEFRRLVRAAVPGSQVRISIYAFSRYGVADEVIAAGKRGVDVRVVVDGLNRFESPAGSGVYVPFTALQKIRAALGEDSVVICSDDEVPVKLKGGCLSSGINHNKFAVFSQLCDGSRHVVFQSSANFSRSMNDVHNNAVIVRDDPALFAGYLDYWTAEAAKVRIPDYFRQIDGQRTRAWFFPRPRTGSDLREPETDTVQGILDNVSCAGGTRVRVAMAFWNDSRDYLVDALAQLRDEGCDVRILTNTNITSDGVKAKLASAFSTDEARLLPHIHSKYLFVDGMYVNTKRKLVWTGSHNWVYGAIRTNEEAILRVDDPAVFAAFDADWNGMWATSTP